MNLQETTRKYLPYMTYTAVPAIEKLAERWAAGDDYIDDEIMDLVEYHQSEGNTLSEAKEAYVAIFQAIEAHTGRIAAWRNL